MTGLHRHGHFAATLVGRAASIELCDVLVVMRLTASCQHLLLSQPVTRRLAVPGKLLRGVAVLHFVEMVFAFVLSGVKLMVHVLVQNQLLLRYAKTIMAADGQSASGLTAVHLVVMGHSLGQQAA